MNHERCDPPHEKSPLLATVAAVGCLARSCCSRWATGPRRTAP